MKFTISDQSKDQYLDFLNKMAIRCIKELAFTNAPKQYVARKVTFSEHANKETYKENIEPDPERFKESGKPNIL